MKLGCLRVCTYPFVEVAPVSSFFTSDRQFSFNYLLIGRLMYIQYYPLTTRDFRLTLSDDIVAGVIDSWA